MDMKLGFDSGIKTGELGMNDTSSSPVQNDSIGDALRADCVAYWKMDEIGGNRLDSTENGHHFVPGGTPTQAEGKINNAMAYDNVAIGEYAVCPSHADLGGGDGQDWCICGWTYFNDLEQTSPTMFSKQRDVGLEYLVFIGSSGGDSVFILENNFEDAVATSVPVLPQTWYFWAAWQDWSAGTFSIQINNGTIHSDDIFAGNAYDPLANILIGDQYEPIPDPTYGLNGKIDEVGFWHRVLTAEERAYLYNSGNGRTLYP